MAPSKTRGKRGAGAAQQQNSRDWSQYTHVPPKQNDISKNGRRLGRSVIRWQRPRMLEKLLLHIEYECLANEIQLPWDNIIHRLNPGSSGKTATQYLARLRKELLTEGHLVPPPAFKSTIAQHDPNIRGYVNDPRNGGVRGVQWNEEIPDIKKAPQKAAARDDPEDDENEAENLEESGFDDYNDDGSDENGRGHGKSDNDNNNNLDDNDEQYEQFTDDDDDRYSGNNDNAGFANDCNEDESDYEEVYRPYQPIARGAKVRTLPSTCIKRKRAVQEFEDEEPEQEFNSNIAEMIKSRARGAAKKVKYTFDSDDDDEGSSDEEEAGQTRNGDQGIDQDEHPVNRDVSPAQTLSSTTTSSRSQSPEPSEHADGEDEVQEEEGMQFESESEDDFYQLDFGAPDQQDLPPPGQRGFPAPGQQIADALVTAPGNEPLWPEDLWAAEHFNRGPRPSNDPNYPELELNDHVWALFDPDFPWHELRSSVFSNGNGEETLSPALPSDYLDPNRIFDV